MRIPTAQLIPTSNTAESKFDKLNWNTTAATRQRWRRHGHGAASEQKKIANLFLTRLKLEIMLVFHFALNSM